MKSYNRDNYVSQQQQQQRWQEGSNRPSAPGNTGDSRGSYNYYPREVETQLLPNEVRIRAAGYFEGYVRQILRTLSSGFPNCKIVARGTATQFAFDVVQEAKHQLNSSKYNFKESHTTALNKHGNEVDELHIMISLREQQQLPARDEGYRGTAYRYSEGGNRGEQYPPSQNYGRQDDRREFTGHQNNCKINIQIKHKISQWRWTSKIHS